MGKLKPVTPGELLLEEFLTPMGIGEIVAGRRSITADTDLRLCRFFGLSNGYWLRAQVAHDTEVAQVELADTLKHITPWQGCPA
jgi:plasmid maintenance system antidote protein VapI